MSGLRQRVFISYSRQPPENSEFVRDLARTLRTNGFDPWLDEEQISGGAHFETEIRNAISTARHGLFVITSRWLERPYTRMELNLFTRHDPKTHSRVAINREGIDPLEIAAQLQQLHIISWPKDDPEPDSRLWEVYAALTRQPPGPRDQWAEKGRRLIIGVGPPQPAADSASRPAGPVPGPATEREWVPCTAPPVLALPTHEDTVVLTDGTECFRVGGGAVRTLPPLHPWAGAAVGPDGTVVVGQYNRMLACLRGDDWEYRSFDAPVLAVAGGSHGVMVGDAAGGVTLLKGSNKHDKKIATGSPVGEVSPTDDGAIVLGTGGDLTRISWDDPDGKPEKYTLAAAFDGPVGLFGLPDPTRVGLFSTTAVATLETDSGRLRIGKRTFPDGIRAVVPLGRQPGYFAVLTDAGHLFHLESNLDSAQPVLLPVEPAEVAGVCRAGSAGLLAWTVGGAVYLVAADRTVRTLATGDVVLSCPDPAAAGQVQVVRWVKDRGVHVQPVRLDQAK